MALHTLLQPERGSRVDTAGTLLALCITERQEHVTVLKPIIFVATFLAGGVATVNAERARGIYLNAGDYEHARLTTESECKSTGHNVELHDVLNKPYIHVTHEGETRRYLKSDIFGFHECDGRDYRFVGTREYRILEARDVLVYSRRRGGRHTHYQYFFSAGAAGPVLPLTREHLKRAFSNNHAFLDALDHTFRRDADLTRYDQSHKMFTVNRLLMTSHPTDRD